MRPLISLRPLYGAFSPRASSIRISWLYLATRSERLIEPVLIWPAAVPTAVSDGSVFSFARTVRNNCSVASVFRHLDCSQSFGQRTDLVEFDQDGVSDAFSIPSFRILVLVTNRSSPTSWILSPRTLVWYAKPSQSDSSRPSSIETIGYCLVSSSRSE